MRRLLVNDLLTAIPGTSTFWSDLVEWFGCEFIGGDYDKLSDRAASVAKGAALIIRNATWFPPIKTQVLTISLLQDIIPEGPMREMQEKVLLSSAKVVFNSEYTKNHYRPNLADPYSLLEDRWRVIPLPVDFQTFEPQNSMGCQQALSLPDGCVLWIGACEGAAGHVKGWDIFRQVVRQNPDIPFVAVLKDGTPEAVPPNLRYYVRLTHQELVRVIGACRVGLCTSRTESQHLAGIEMGACGLPLVVPPVGCYWQRSDFPGGIVSGDDPRAYTAALRNILSVAWMPEQAREHFRKEFDKPVIKAQWTKIIEEVEGGNDQNRV